MTQLTIHREAEVRRDEQRRIVEWLTDYARIMIDTLHDDPDPDNPRPEKLVDRDIVMTALGFSAAAIKLAEMCGLPAPDQSDLKAAFDHAWHTVIAVPEGS